MLNRSKETSMQTQTRKELLEQLVRFERPPEELSRELEPFGLHSDDYLVHLEYKHIVHILTKYVYDELTAEDVRDWASALELRDDIDFGEEDSNTFDLIYKFATPELEGPLTPTRAQGLLAVLSSALPTQERIDEAYYPRRPSKL